MNMRVLIVEDDALLATDMADQLEQHGFGIVGPCLTSAQALWLVKTEGCDAAVLDINMGEETSEPLAKTLLEAATPFVVVSGYLGSQRPDIFDNAPALSKPVKMDDLVSLLKKAS